MNTLLRLAAPLALGACLVCAVAPALSRAEAPAKHYVCVPCGLPCDGAVYDKPGICPKCGMALVDRDSVTTHPRQKVAILIFDGVEIIDYSGPYEVFGAADFDVYTVAETKDPVTTAMGMTVVPKYTFADAPQPDVLVVPGGGVRAAQNSAPTLKWVTDATAGAVHTMSVCNGAFILASAGLLDGLTATTTSGNIDRLRAQYPKIKVVDDRRYVDNGKIITTAGLSAGIDGALHVVATMLGDGTAQEVALGEEYDWRSRSDFARAALADRLIPDLGLQEVGRWDVVRTEGSTTRWDLVVRGTSDLGVAELMDHVARALTTKGKWTSVKAASAGPASRTTSGWNFSGRDGRRWTGTLKVESAPGESHHYTAELSIARAS